MDTVLQSTLVRVWSYAWNALAGIEGLVLFAHLYLNFAYFISSTVEILDFSDTYPKRLRYMSETAQI